MAEQPNLNRLFQTAGQQKQQAGTGYTNLNRLFQANQGNQLGQKVAGNIQKQVGNVQSQLGQQQQEFQTESEKNKLGNEADVAKRSEIIGRFAPASGNPASSNPVDNSANPKQGAADFVGSGRSGGLLAQSGVAKPEPTLSDTDVSDFGRFTGGQYGGPQGLRDTGALQSTAANLKGQVTNFSPSGTQELLRRSVGGERYTQGQQRLDSLLMDKSALTPVARQATALSQNINRANLAASGQAELNKNLAQRFGEETQGQLTAGMTGIDTAVKGQLTAAQAVEAGRESQLQNLMNTLQGDMIPKLDPSGKQVLDENGKPVMERKLSGTTDPYARMDEISKSLKDQNLVNTNQYESLFGKGAFTENKAGYEKNLAGIRKQEVLDKILGTGGYQSATGAGIGKGLYDLSQNNALTSISDYQGQGTGVRSQAASNTMQQMQNYIAANKLDANDSNSYNVALGELFKSGQIGESELNKLSGNFQAQTGGQNRQTYNLGGNNTMDLLGTQFGDLNPVMAKRAEALESFKGATGLAGRSTLDNRQDEFYNTLAKSLGNATTGAEGLTEAGVASDKQRASYEALNKLMGKTSSESKYRTDDPTKYKAGQINLDAAQIKRSLGY